MYTVRSVSSCPAPLRECLAVGLVCNQSDGGPIHLPLITIGYIEGETALYRLPIVLAGWAARMLKAGRDMGRDVLPCAVEFKIVAGRYIATVKGFNV